jgi:hypothetical protein
MNDTYINMLLALAAVAVPLVLGGLLIELHARSASKRRPATRQGSRSQ